ncbi:SDR family NAD(P)-dependent oxidoreductase [Amycolatopsis sp. NPDC006131]|uniref:SDR family NAD(P)-dependent oxidoreductase n=1 Tax=Amycolatopsis sp. NPDC006131 TaxID=3156731 RepID=UPI0033B93AE5
MNRDTIVLTGATSGIGRAAAHLLAPAARRLIVHGHEPAGEVQSLLDGLRAAGAAEVHYLSADFDELAAVERLAAGITGRVDVLINNAGRPGPARRRLSADGIEATLQTNYLAAALLTERLTPALTAAGGRVVHVASATHLSAGFDLDDVNLDRHPYSPTTAYARSKLAMVAHALWLAGRPGSPEIVSISPGVISTDLLHAMYGIGGAPVGHGARNVVHAALSPDVHTGQYLDDGAVAQPSAVARDPEFQAGLAALTRDLLGLRS